MASTFGDNDLRAILGTSFSSRPTEFPKAGGVNYYETYNLIANELNSTIHPKVNIGSLLADGSYLTDHGCDHVEMVIRRASNLIASLECNLSGYEAYLLLMGIHFHDVGNISGRAEHESKISDIMQKIPLINILESTEKRMIRDIAVTHGGKVNESKDTIGLSQLQDSDYLLGKEIRPRFLAALLRFSDELADENTRADRYSLEAGDIPMRNEAYHAYSNSLTSFAIDGREISLKFEMTIADAT